MKRNQSDRWFVKWRVPFFGRSDPAPEAEQRANADPIREVGGPVSRPWREGALTRAAELGALSAWVQAKKGPPQQHSEVLVSAIYFHLEAAREAAEGGKRTAVSHPAEAPESPKKRFGMPRTA
jgi:hypothetical protein